MRNTEIFISVLMPVYNAGKFLHEAIDSILEQTHSHFEFIIINDASTDDSEKIILSYKDQRIRYYKNESNLGLIKTLNKGIDLAKGEYVARMDNDDVAYKERLEIQLNYLKEHFKAKMVCSPVVFISSDGKEKGFWPADRNAKTTGQIIATLPWENCIAHPTVMIETKLLQKYTYSQNQKGSEDWDLWLRLVRDKVSIIKTKEVLLKYRVHGESMTNMHNTRQSPQIKSVIVKIRFVLNSLKKLRLNFFVLKTFITIYKDLGYYFKMQTAFKAMKTLKRVLSIDPFKAYVQYKDLKRILEKNNSSYFLFFPYSHIGGAEKVHAQITKVLEEKKPFVFFTGINNHSDYSQQFGSKALILHVAAALYHPLFSGKSEKLILEKIDSANSPVLFGCNNLFFYDSILKIRKDIYVVDLTHDYNYEQDKELAEKYLPSYLRCDQRVFISNSAVKRTIGFYERHFIDESFTGRIKLIYNYVEEPPEAFKRQWIKPYRIIYVGRDTVEKRVDLIFELAKKCEENHLPFEFICVGPIKERPAFLHLKKLKREGMILDQRRMSELYGSSHFVIISSGSEGFPLTLMEGMIRGCIPLSTAVGDIPFHIKKNENGFLVDSKEDLEVVNDFFDLLVKIRDDEIDLESLSHNAVNYARNMFGKENFVNAYRKLLKLD
jgi:glycosyltransferase involved in cell wall biosynthesis